MRYIEKIIIVAFLVVPLCASYLSGVYNSFFGEQPGYIYDSKSDYLYWLKLGPSIYRFQHWKRHLLPFSSPSFTVISSVDRQSSLKKVLREQNGLLDAVASGRDIEDVWQELSTSVQTSTDRDVEFIGAKYWVRRDLDPKTMLPPQWRRLPEEVEDFDRAVIPADVVIARYTPTGSDPIDIEILRGVLILTTAAAYAVNSRCFYPHKYQWEECAKRE